MGYCAAITWCGAKINKQYMWLCCYDKMPCQYLWRVYVNVMLWHNTLSLFMNSTCECVATTICPANIYEEYMWTWCYDITQPLFMNSTCDCVAMTWHTATIYEEYIWLCCYDMMPCHYLWTVHRTVLLWHDPLPLFMNSTCDCVAMTWCPATIYEQYIDMTVLLWHDALTTFMNSTYDCVAMTCCPDNIYEQYIRLCCYDMMPCHYLWTVHVTVLLWHDKLPLFMNSTCDCVVWHDTLPLFMNSTCDCVGMTWCPDNMYEQ